jgi:hypothetical protein
MNEENNAPNRGGSRSSTDLNLVARLGSKARGLREQLKVLTIERDELKTQLDALRDETGPLRRRADTSAAAQESDRLRQELRGLKHRQAFDRLALARGLHPEALGDAWQLAGYTAEADEPDEAALAGVVDEAERKRPYLFGGPAPAPKPEPRPGPAAGRGDRNGAGAPAFSDELARTDVAYVMKHYDNYVAAAKAGTIR